MLRRLSVFLFITIPLSGAQALPYDSVVEQFDAITAAMTSYPDDVQRSLVDTKIAIDQRLPDIDGKGLALVRAAEGITSAKERAEAVGEVLDAMKEPLKELRAASASLNERSRADELRALRIDVFTRLQRLDNLIKALVAPLLGIETASRLIARAEELSDQVCECDDKECVGEVIPELEKFRKRWMKSRANENTKDAVDTAIKRAGTCIAERAPGLTKVE